MRHSTRLVLSFALTFVIAPQVGCAQKTTRKATLETPEKKYEVKVEKTEKK